MIKTAIIIVAVVVIIASFNPFATLAVSEINGTITAGKEDGQNGQYAAFIVSDSTVFERINWPFVLRASILTIIVSQL